MLVTFQSKAGNITMFGGVAVTLLRMMGQSGTIPGAIAPDRIPEAVARLKSAVAAEPGAVVEGEPPPDEEKGERPIGLHQRAWPLIQLLEAAAARGYHVMWQREGAA